MLVMVMLKVRGLESSSAIGPTARGMTESITVARALAPSTWLLAFSRRIDVATAWTRSTGWPMPMGRVVNSVVMRLPLRSEERRVGKGGRSGGWAYDWKENK